MSRRTLVLVLSVLVALTVGGVLIGRSVDVQRLCVRIAELSESGGPGIVVFVLGYAASTALAMPASWFMGGASFLYGPWIGIPMAWLLSIGFGALCFELARGKLRGPVSRRLGRNPRLAALDRASRDDGLRLVMLLRLSPMSPYNAMSYLLGLTAVTRRQFVLGTALGSIIPILVWGAVGASLTDFAALVSGEEQGPAWVRRLILGITAAATVGVILFVRRALGRVAPPEPAVAAPPA